MIFKTFKNNDVDKWTAKIGLFGKSFNDVIDSINDVIDSINKRKLDIDNLMSSGLVASHSDAKKQVGGLFSYLYSKNDIKDVKDATHTENGSQDRTLSRHGNIGVTTSQQMINSEIELWQWNFFSEVFKDIDKILTIQTY